MIKSGDRIFGSFADDCGVVSGIVSQAIDVGYACWCVVVWDGQRKGMKSYELAVVSEFEIQVLERDCAFPPVPEDLYKVLVESAESTRREFDSKHPPRNDPVIQLAREVNRRSGLRLVIEAAKTSLLSTGYAPDAAREAIREHLILASMKQQHPKGTTVADIETLYIAACLELDDAFGVLAEEGAGT